MLIKVPQGQDIEYAGEGTLKEIFVELDKGLLKKYIAARAEGEHVDFHTRLRSDAEVELIPWDAEEAAWIYRHSMSHVLAQAVVRLFPEAQLAIGPAIEDGFYYDFARPEPFTPDDLVTIEARMQEIVKRDEEITREVWPRDKAVEFFTQAGEAYKAELIAAIPEGEDVTLYRQGDFIDLCRGPHLPSTGRIGAFKLTKIAGAYWRGDSNNEMLQRIYGTAWATEKHLKAYLFRLEEAEKRDHRRLGREMGLFHQQ